MVCSYSRTPLFLRKWYSQNEEGILNRVFCLSVVHEANEAARVSFLVSAQKQKISFRVLHATLNVFFSKSRQENVEDTDVFFSHISLASVRSILTPFAARLSSEEIFQSELSHRRAPFCFSLVFSFAPQQHTKDDDEKMTFHDEAPSSSSTSSSSKG